MCYFFNFFFSLIAPFVRLLQQPNISWLFQLIDWYLINRRIKSADALHLSIPAQGLPNGDATLQHATYPGMQPYPGVGTYIFTSQWSLFLFFILFFGYPIQTTCLINAPNNVQCCCCTLEWIYSNETYKIDLLLFISFHFLIFGRNFPPGYFRYSYIYSFSFDIMFKLVFSSSEFYPIP